jgi:hypothetical protein
LRSPDFKLSDGTVDPEASLTNVGIVSGALLIIPLFYFVEKNPAPVGTPVILDGIDGDVTHASTDNSFNPPYEYDRLRILNNDGKRFVIVMLSYGANFKDRDALLSQIVSSFQFVRQ